MSSAHLDMRTPKFSCTMLRVLVVFVDGLLFVGSGGVDEGELICVFGVGEGGACGGVVDVCVGFG